MSFYPIVNSTSSGKDSSDTTSHTINLPSGIQSGNYLIIIVATDGGTGSNATISGWTRKVNQGISTTLSVLPCYYGSLG